MGVTKVIFTSISTKKMRHLLIKKKAYLSNKKELSNNEKLLLEKLNKEGVLEEKEIKEIFKIFDLNYNDEGLKVERALVLIKDQPELNINKKYFLAEQGWLTRVQVRYKWSSRFTSSSKRR